MTCYVNIMMKRKPLNTIISLRLAPDLYRDAVRIARRREISVSLVIRDALRKAVEEEKRRIEPL